MIKEIPILFSTEMVKAILEGRKNMTRRMKGLERMNENPLDWRVYEGDFFIDKKSRINQKFFNIKGGYSDHAICPYGQPGDVLWVRESFCKMDGDIFFKASVNHPETLKWKPSIHMLKANARIWLQVEEIRVERLQDITEEDARAEGIQRYFNDLFQEERYFDYAKAKPGQFKNERLFGTPGGKEWREAISSFESLWIKINGPESWDLNPWVWVVKFKVLSTTGKSAIVNCK